MYGDTCAGVGYGAMVGAETKLPTAGRPLGDCKRGGEKYEELFGKQTKITILKIHDLNVVSGVLVSGASFQSTGKARFRKVKVLFHHHHPVQ